MGFCNQEQLLSFSSDGVLGEIVDFVIADRDSRPFGRDNPENGGGQDAKNLRVKVFCLLSSQIADVLQIFFILKTLEEGGQEILFFCSKWLISLILFHLVLNDFELLFSSGVWHWIDVC